MKKIYLFMRIPCFCLIAIFLLMHEVTAQNKVAVHQGVLRIKVAETTATYLQKAQMSRTSQGYLRTGNASLDQALSRSKATNMKRVFRHGGKFEAKHRKHGLHLWYEVQIDESTDVNQAVSMFGKLSEVIKSEPIYEKSIGGRERMLSEAKIMMPLNSAPDDPRFVDQWHYNNTGQTGGTPGADISLLQAWSTETGDSQVIVAVTDGGIDVDHEDLAANMWVNTDEIPDNDIDDDNNGYVDDIYGYGFGDNTGEIPADLHGTHVGGTVSAVTNNGIGVSGVAGGDGSGNGVRLMSCAAFGASGTGGFAETYIYGADNGAVISQNSWGYTSAGVFEQAVLDAIDYFIAEAGYDEMGNPVGPMQGGLVIFAAGNDGSFGEYYPGFYDPVLAVGGTDHNDDQYVSSNRGDWVDVAAPAVNVLSTFPNNQYSSISGTSMACPHVSGLAALIVSQNIGNITPDQVWARIEQTTDPLPGLEFLGSGRINAFAALQQDDGVAPEDITDLSVADVDLSSVTLQWTAPADAGNGSASSYDVRYSTSPITAANFDSATPVADQPKASLAGTLETYTVTGLNSATEYYFAIKSEDFFGNVSGISNVVSATTNDAPVASVSPSSLTADVVTGETETQTLTISNDGLGPLDFDISFGGTVFTPSMASTQPKTIKPHSKMLSTRKAYTQSGVQVLAGAQYSTGFESFNTGTLNNQDGWSTSSTQDYDVSTAMPYAGTKHVLGTSTAAGANSLAFSPNVGIGEEAYSSTSAKIKIEGTGVTWQYIPQSPTAELVVTRLSFDADGGMSILDGDAGDYVDIPAETPSGYFDMKMVVHRESLDMNVYINNELVYVGKAFAGDIEQVVLLSPMEATGSEFYMDDMQIYDGEIDTYPFLSADITSGTVPAGESQDIQVTFDATGLFGGTYQNEIQISTNDPVNSEFVVPATMNVEGTGKPVVTVNPDSLVFLDTFVGGTDTRVLEITNGGTEILQISSIQSTSPDFSIVSADTAITLMPFETHEVTVQFSPSSLGEVTGDIVIYSNDTDTPELHVPARGNGVEAPIIAVNPSSLEAELERGDTTSRVLTITNNGVATLNFAIEVSAAGGDSTTSVSMSLPARASRAMSTEGMKQQAVGSFAGMQVMSNVHLSADNVQVLILTPDDDVSDLQSALSAFPDLDVSIYPETALPDITLADVADYDVIMTTNNTQWLAGGNVSPALIGDLLADYIDQGGKVIANCFAYDYDAWALEGRFITENYGPFTVSSTDFNNDVTLGTVHEPGHPIMENVSSIGNTFLFQDPGLAPGATLIADWSDGNPFVAANDNVVALNLLPSSGDGVPGWTGDLPTLYHNAIMWLSGASFVSTDIKEGTLSGGESIDVNVAISAEGLEAGFYEASIDITSNDPVNGLVQVPVSLNVLGPAVTANPEFFDVTVIKGLSETRQLTLSNNGSLDAEYVIDVVNGAPEPEPTFAAGYANTPPRSNAFSGAAMNVAAAVAKGAAQMADGDEIYRTGFENFVTGNINGQQGWTGQFGNWRIEATNPATGSQHFRGLSDGLGQSAAFTPQLEMGGEAVATASMDVDLEAGASWWISTESSTAINGRVIFDPQGNVVMVSDDGAGGAVLDTLTYNVPDDYFNIAFEVDKVSGNFKFYIDNVEVYEGKAFSTDLEFVAVVSQMETAGPTFDMDNLSVYEGRLVPPFLSLSDYAGVIPAGSSVTLDVEFDGSQIDFGTYFRDIQVFIGGASSPDLVIPATFTVTGQSSVEVTPQVLEQVVNYKEEETTEFTIKNTGGKDLNFDIGVFGADLEDQQMRMAEANVPAASRAKFEKSLAYEATQVRSASVVQLVAGETIFTENFDGGTFPPANWTVVDNEGSGLVWSPLADQELENWAGSGEAASVNSDANQGVEFDTELITPAIDISGRTGVVVQYNANYRNFLGSDFLDLEVTTDDGATWTTVLSWNESHGTGFGAPGEFVVVELDEYVAGASEMKLRWRYYDPNTGDWDFYAQIDDVEILTDATTWLTVSPASGTVPVGEELKIDVAFDASKVDPGEYFAGILVNSNAANMPVASVFAMMEVLRAADIEVSPTSLEQVLVTGFSDTQTLNITNNGESVLRYELGGYLKNSKVVSVSKNNSERIEPNLRTAPYDGELYQGKKAIALSNVERTAGTLAYGTDFESFELGDINNQNGWFAQFGNWTVEAENADSGVKHFRGLSDGLGQSAAITPGVGIGTEPVSSFTTDVNLTGTGVTWQLIPQSTTAELVITRLQINPDGSMDALVDDGAGGTVFETIIDAVDTSYFNLKLEVERATSEFTVYVDQEAIYTGQGFAGDIEEVVVLSLMETAGPTLDLDDLNIWDGEAPIPFLSANPEFGNVASGETVEIEVTFDATNLEKGIYKDQIIVFNNDPDEPEVEIPVTLEVINPPVLEVSPDTIISDVVLNTMKEHTVTIANAGEANLRFGFAGYGDAPVPGEFRREDNFGPERRKKMQEDIDKSRAYNPARPITFLEGEQLLFEGFEGTTFPPEGWTLVDNEGTGVVWESSDENYTGGTGKSAIANSDAAGTAEFDTELITPEVNIEGKSGVAVQYYVNYQNYLNQDFLNLDISTDGGSSWTTVLSWNEDHGGLFTVPGEFVSVPLDEYLEGASTMMLRWHYFDPNTGDFDWYAQIDEVEIIYEGIQWLTVDPGQGIVPGGESLDVTVTFDATEVEKGQYVKDLLLLTNVPSEPEKVLHMVMNAVGIEPLTLESLCSDNPDEERRWSVYNPNSFEVDTYWFIIGSNEGDSLTVKPGENIFTSNTLSDRPNTLKLKWLDENQQPQETVKESAFNPCGIEELTLESPCSNNPDLFRRWKVTNANPFGIMVNWEVLGTTQSGSLWVANGVTYFYTEAIAGDNTARISWLDAEGEEHEVVTTSTGEVCDIDNSCMGDEVISFTQGLRKKGTMVPPRRSNPELALGMPEENSEINFVSLGFGGELVIKLNNIVADQPGDDFIVFETTYDDVNDECGVYPETADVYVSDNGVDFYFVGSACKDTAFDIANSGLLDIQYIKIVDTSDINYKGFGPAADGFDVDGIHCINAHYSAARHHEFGLANTVPNEPYEKAITTFPNPFQDEISVTMEVEKEGVYEVMVHDIFGALIYKGKVNSSLGELRTEIDARGFARGTYTITITSEDEHYKESSLLIKK